TTEAKGKVAVSGTVGKDVKAGDIVHLTVDGKDLGTATVNADLTWTAQVDGATLESATKDSVHASVTTTGKAGNSATAETDHIYSIDTKIDAEITITKIAEDDVINATEAKGQVAISGTVDKDVKAGDIVHLTVDGNYLGKATVNSDLTWTAQVDGATLASASKDSVHASVTTTDKAGNSATAETDHIYSIDTKIDAEITIIKIAEDDVINATEAKGQVAVSGTVGADVKAGDIVHLTVDGKVLGTATVKADLTWSTLVDGATLENATKDSVHASVTTTDKAGNSATAETDHIYNIDTEIAAAITITNIADDDVINATEAKGKVAVSGTVGADVKAGDIVHLTVDGNYLGKATVNSDLTWSTLVDGATLENAAKDSVHASVTTIDKAGNSATAQTDHLYSIDTQIAATITITNIADDDVINAAEAKDKVTVSGTVDKDVKAGDIVHLTVDGKDLGTATVKADLTWSTQVDGATLASASKDSVHASVTTTDKAGNSATAETNHAYSIDTDINAAITITNIADDDVINATEAKGKVAVSGTVDKDVKAGDIVHLTVDGKVLGTATVKADLTWTAQVDGATLENATKDSVHASVTTTDKAGNSATAETNHAYSIDTDINAAITITNIADDDVINATEAKGKVAVSGTVDKDVKAGDIVHLTVDGKVLGTATVNADLTWTAQVDGATLASASKDSVHASVTTTDKAGN
ncbi:Ig-like domain-containing protein, partial [Shewanella marina]|uniref:Ig-like domain-containing protein n=1 Tax=Shewanella marina TaxID=487319 RepID=UPI0005603B9F